MIVNRTTFTGVIISFHRRCFRLVDIQNQTSNKQAVCLIAFVEPFLVFWLIRKSNFSLAMIKMENRTGPCTLSGIYRQLPKDGVFVQY